MHADKIQAFFAPIKVAVPEVGAMATFDVKVPIKIVETADVTRSEPFTILIGVANDRGEEVGYAVPIKVKITAKMDETALYDKAMQLMAQCGLTFDEQGNFERAISALKKADYHVDKAAALLVADRQPFEDKDVTDDLYE